MSEHAPDASPDLAARVADATDANWVDRFAPLKARPYLRLSRADRPAGTWLLLLPCWQSLALAIAADGWRPGDLWLVLAFAIGAFLMRGAGCTWNDVTDRDFDGQVERTRSRPIPAGQVSVRGALVWMCAQALAAFAVLLTFPPFAIWMGVVSLALVAIYPFMKRVTWWPQIFLGLAFNWGAWMGWAGHFGEIGWAPALLYVSGIAWTLGYDTIYAHQDKEDDALIGVKSTARLFAEGTRAWLAVFYVATVALAAGAVAVSGAATGSPMAALAAWGGVAAYAAHFAWQLRRLEIDDPARCLALFRSNRDAGLILLAALLVAGLF